MNDNIKCSMCGSNTDKVIYMGLPGIFCQNRNCNCLDGIAAWAPVVEDHQGRGFCFMIYRGSYLKALWHWLKGDDDENR